MGRMLSSLRFKLSLSIIAILVVGIGITAWRNIQVLDRQLLEFAKDQADLLLEDVHGNVMAAMLTMRRQEIQELLERFRGHRGIVAVRIFDERGMIHWSSNPREVGELFSGKGPLDIRNGNYFLYSGPNGDPLLRMSRAIPNEKRCFSCHDPAKRINGIVSVDVSLSPIRDRISEVHQVLLPSAALTVVAVFLGIWFSLSRTVTHPISLLIKAMRRTEAGDFSARISLQRRDEVGQLADRFNTMGEKLSSARRELEQYHQQQMMRAEKMVSLGQLASSIAHEIKNPLAGISGALQVLAAEFPNGHPNREIVKEVRGQVDRLNQVVQNLLDFAKPAQPRFVEADIHEILARVLFLVKQEARESGIEIQEKFASDLPSVWVDEKKIQQVFLNISLNALQAMGAGGKLTIRTRAMAADSVEVDFQDTGPGIPQEFLNTVFQPFFTTKPKGTGLGLSIARRIMQEHGGDIRVRSELKSGTCFSLSFSTQKKSEGVSVERQEEWHAAL